MATQESVLKHELKIDDDQTKEKKKKKSGHMVKKKKGQWNNILYCRLGRKALDGIWNKKRIKMFSTRQIHTKEWETKGVIENKKELLD